MTPTFGAENKMMSTSFQMKVKLPGLSLYPNPVTDFLTIVIDDTREHQVSMYNLFGQLMDQWRFGSTKTIDVRSLSPGIYFISVDGLGSGKFIKK